MKYLKLFENTIFDGFFPSKPLLNKYKDNYQAFNVRTIDFNKETIDLILNQFPFFRNILSVIKLSVKINNIGYNINLYQGDDNKNIYVEIHEYNDISIYWNDHRIRLEGNCLKYKVNNDKIIKFLQILLNYYKINDILNIKVDNPLIKKFETSFDNSVDKLKINFNNKLKSDIVNNYPLFIIKDFDGKKDFYGNERANYLELRYKINDSYNHIRLYELKDDYFFIEIFNTYYYVYKMDQKSELIKVLKLIFK